jgi:hypothetical protein
MQDAANRRVLNYTLCSAGRRFCEVRGRLNVSKKFFREAEKIVLIRSSTTRMTHFTNSRNVWI